MKNRPKIKIKVKKTMTDARSQVCVPTVHQTRNNIKTADMVQEYSQDSTPYSKVTILARSECKKNEVVNIPYCTQG